MLDQKSKFGVKKFWVKNENFGSKIEILVKNRNFGQKSKFWVKIEILVKNRNFRQSRILRQKSNFTSKIEILRQKSKFWVKIENVLNTVDTEFSSTNVPLHPVFQNIFAPQTRPTRAL